METMNAKRKHMTVTEAMTAMNWIKAHPEVQTGMTREQRLAALNRSTGLELTYGQIYNLEFQMGLTKKMVPDVKVPPPFVSAEQSLATPNHSGRTGDLEEIVKRMRRMETMLYRMAQHIGMEPRAPRHPDQMIDEVRAGIDALTTGGLDD